MKNLLLLLVLAVCLTACGAGIPEAPAEAVPRVLTVCVGTEGTSIDPAYLSESDPADYLSHLFEGLMKYAPVSDEAVMNDMTVTCGLASSVEISEDATVYRFTIREDALWSDGKSVTAADFVYAWNRLRDTDTHGSRQLWSVAEQVTAEHDRLLTVRLKAPCAYFLKLCAQPYAAPVRRDVVEAYGGDWTAAANIVVSGGYTVAEWVHDDCLRLRKNPLYYGADSIGPDEICWYFADTDRVSADFTADVPAEWAQGSVDMGGVYYLYLNANAVRDWRVRAAMLLALDRQRIAAAVGGTAADGLVPAGIAGTDGGLFESDTAPMYAWLRESYPAYDLDTYAGRCALALDLYNEAVAAGTWSHGRTLRFQCCDNPSARRVMELCREDWLRVLGLTVGESVLSEADYEKRLQTNTFDVAHLSWLPDYDDPMSFLQIMERGGEYNYSAWGDARYDAMLEQAAVSADDRDCLLSKAEAALFEKERFAICPVYRLSECYAAGSIRGAAHGGNGYWFGNVTLE